MEGEKDYWLIYSNYDLTLYPVKAAYENYYIVAEDLLHYLSDIGISYHVLDKVNPKDFIAFVQRITRLETGKRYIDSFTIFHFPLIKLVSQTDKVYIFRYKDYEIVVRKKLCPNLELLEKY